MEQSDQARGFPPQPILSALVKRFLQALALYIPGEGSLRPLLHRWRGVKMGTGVHIGTLALIETSFPEWVSIGNGVTIGVRATIVAHLQGLPPRKEELKDYVSVRIEDDAYLGPGVIVLPNVTIGRGAVVMAGSVVTRSVPPLTMIQGNPARPIAQCGIPLARGTPLKEFYRHLRPTKP